jgi:outer membrane immunogenic protein
MRHFLLSTIALAALTGSAFAADLPSTKSAPVFVAPVSVYNWTGFYLGADVGGIWGQGKFQNTNNVTRTTSPSSVIGGGYAGYNYQINQFVLGVQGEIDGTGVSGTNATTGLGLKETYLASIDGRLGYAIDRVLFYAIGGVAFTDTKFALGTTSYNGSSTGYDVGGGVEYAFLPNWTVRAEYRYYDFGKTNYAPANLNVAVIPGFSLAKSDNVFRVGLDYKFGAPEPVAVAAKY